MNLKTEGKWDEAKGRIREAWGALTDDDLDKTGGKWDRIVGTIKEKTGEAIDTVEEKMHKLFDKVDEKRADEKRKSA